MFQTRLDENILFVFEKGKPDIDVFKEICQKLNASEIIHIETLQDVDYSPHFLYKLSGNEFELINDPMFDTHLIGDKETLLEVEKIILS